MADIKANSTHTLSEEFALKSALMMDNMFVNRENNSDDLPLLTKQKLFGYTWEDINMTIKPTVEKGTDPIGAMGTDTPMAVLSE